MSLLHLNTPEFYIQLIRRLRLTSTHRLRVRKWLTVLQAILDRQFNLPSTLREACFDLSDFLQQHAPALLWPWLNQLQNHMTSPRMQQWQTLAQFAAETAWQKNQISLVTKIITHSFFPSVAQDEKLHQVWVTRLPKLYLPLIKDSQQVTAFTALLNKFTLNLGTEGWYKLWQAMSVNGTRLQVEAAHHIWAVNYRLITDEAIRLCYSQSVIALAAVGSKDCLRYINGGDLVGFFLNNPNADAYQCATAYERLFEFSIAHQVNIPTMCLLYQTMQQLPLPEEKMSEVCCSFILKVFQHKIWLLLNVMLQNHYQENSPPSTLQKAIYKTLLAQISLWPSHAKTPFATFFYIVQETLKAQLPLDSATYALIFRWLTDLNPTDMLLQGISSLPRCLALLILPKLLQSPPDTYALAQPIQKLLAEVVAQTEPTLDFLSILAALHQLSLCDKDPTRWPLLPQLIVDFFLKDAAQLSSTPQQIQTALDYFIIYYKDCYKSISINIYIDLALAILCKLFLHYQQQQYFEDYYVKITDLIKSYHFQDQFFIYNYHDKFFHFLNQSTCHHKHLETVHFKYMYQTLLTMLSGCLEHTFPLVFDTGRPALISHVNAFYFHTYAGQLEHTQQHAYYMCIIQPIFEQVCDPTGAELYCMQLYVAKGRKRPANLNDEELYLYLTELMRFLSECPAELGKVAIEIAHNTFKLLKHFKPDFSSQYEYQDLLLNNIAKLSPATALEGYQAMAKLLAYPKRVFGIGCQEEELSQARQMHLYCLQGLCATAHTYWQTCTETLEDDHCRYFASAFVYVRHLIKAGLFKNDAKAPPEERWQNYWNFINLLLDMPIAGLERCKASKIIPQQLSRLSTLLYHPHFETPSAAIASIQAKLSSHLQSDTQLTFDTEQASRHITAIATTFKAALEAKNNAAIINHLDLLIAFPAYLEDMNLAGYAMDALIYLYVECVDKDGMQCYLSEFASLCKPAVASTPIEYTTPNLQTLIYDYWQINHRFALYLIIISRLNHTNYTSTEQRKAILTLACGLLKLLTDNYQNETCALTTAFYQVALSRSAHTEELAASHCNALENNPQWKFFTQEHLCKYPQLHQTYLLFTKVGKSFTTSLNDDARWEVFDSYVVRGLLREPAWYPFTHACEITKNYLQIVGGKSQSYLIGLYTQLITRCHELIETNSQAGNIKAFVMLLKCLHYMVLNTFDQKYSEKLVELHHTLIAYLHNISADLWGAKSSLAQNQAPQDLLQNVINSLVGTWQYGAYKADPSVYFKQLQNLLPSALLANDMHATAREHLNLTLGAPMNLIKEERNAYAVEFAKLLTIASPTPLNEQAMQLRRQVISQWLIKMADQGFAAMAIYLINEVKAIKECYQGYLREYVQLIRKLKKNNR